MTEKQWTEFNGLYLIDGKIVARKPVVQSGLDIVHVEALEVTIERPDIGVFDRYDANSSAHQNKHVPKFESRRGNSRCDS